MAIPLNLLEEGGIYVAADESIWMYLGDMNVRGERKRLALKLVAKVLYVDEDSLDIIKELRNFDPVVLRSIGMIARNPESIMDIKMSGNWMKLIEADKRIYVTNGIFDSTKEHVRKWLEICPNYNEYLQVRLKPRV